MIFSGHERVFACENRKEAQIVDPNKVLENVLKKFFIVPAGPDLDIRIMVVGAARIPPDVDVTDDNQTSLTSVASISHKDLAGCVTEFCIILHHVSPHQRLCLVETINLPGADYMDFLDYPPDDTRRRVEFIQRQGEFPAVRISVFHHVADPDSETLEERINDIPLFFRVGENQHSAAVFNKIGQGRLFRSVDIRGPAYENDQVYSLQPVHFGPLSGLEVFCPAAAVFYLRFQGCKIVDVARVFPP